MNKLPHPFHTGRFSAAAPNASAHPSSIPPLCGCGCGGTCKPESSSATPRLVPPITFAHPSRIPPEPSEQALKIAMLEKVNATLLDALKELVDLMNATRIGDYTPDSLTCQPAELAIAAAETLPDPLKLCHLSTVLGTNGYVLYLFEEMER